MNQCWYVINKSPRFTLGLTLGSVSSMGFGKCTMRYIRHFSVIQNIFTALKILCALLIPLSASCQPLVLLLSL